MSVKGINTVTERHKVHQCSLRYQHPSAVCACLHAEGWANHQIWNWEATPFQISSTGTAGFCLSFSAAQCGVQRHLQMSPSKSPASREDLEVPLISPVLLLWHNYCGILSSSTDLESVVSSLEMYSIPEWYELQSTWLCICSVPFCIWRGTDWTTWVVPFSPLSSVYLCGWSLVLERLPWRDLCREWWMQS